MIATEVGFAGGTTPSPTYHDLGDHFEVVQVTYDPAVVSYEALLAEYWALHPHGLEPPEDSRVAVAILPRSAQERAVAARFLESRGGVAALEELRDFGSFTPAVSKQQKFHLQRARGALVEELATRFASREAFLASTAAARLNAVFMKQAGPEVLVEAARELGVDVDLLECRLAGASEPSLAVSR